MSLHAPCMREAHRGWSVIQLEHVLIAGTGVSARRVLTAVRAAEFSTTPRR
jgi:hypothetical protein